MLLFLRRLKHLEFMSNEFRKYLLYALGEMTLVVIGILIALQIDNWNSDRKEAATLESYLQTIARNMREDISELQALKSTRSTRIVGSFRATNFLTGARKQSFTVDEIYFFRKTMIDASENLSFNADDSGYEALKNSGAFERLQGQDLERVLSRYYDRVTHIEDLEARLNAALGSLFLQYRLTIPYDVVSWAFDDPRALLPGQFDEFQPMYGRVINGPAVRELLSVQFGSFEIVREYDRLQQLGDAFIDMVDSGRMYFRDPGERSLLLVERTDAPSNYADLVSEGQVVVQNYYVAAVTAGFQPVFDFRSIDTVGDSMHIDYPGSESWASVYLAYLGNEMGRPSLDFSQFDRLVLELKGDRGDEVITVAIKDRDLPDTVPPESTELRLTDDWQIYEIDLAIFGKTDLGHLITPLAFNFEREPQSFSLRNARYVRTEPEPQ